MITAVTLALLSVAPVAWSLLQAPSAWQLTTGAGANGPIDWHAMTPEAAFLLAVSAVLPAAILGGALGGWLWVSLRASGVFLAIAVAWPTAIIALPLAADVFDIPLRTGIVCITSCEAHLRDDQAFSGVDAYRSLLLGSFIGAPLLVLPAALLGLARLFHNLAFSVAGAVALHAVINWWSINADGGRIPYLTLVAGTLLWAAWLLARDARLADESRGPGVRTAVELG